ncbi:LacI family DNA-binding transcriptional regulator [Granulicella sibirica]|uniref:LacI family DNA-binding transcriptional regulator n=1 Tax=Granulicella sibirica TaxID=2479048 RepID=UPI001008F716|nr:LacI family DNA-binding transcriptional regulator [Granulicella sibirica]
MKEIAARAGVSVGTVSHVLNNPGKVRDERRLRVEEVIRSLGYQPSQLARGLRKKTTDLLGVIIPDITNPFFPSVVRGAEDVAFREGFRLILCNADNDPIKEQIYFKDLRAFQPAGIIVIPSVESMLQQEIADSHLPVVIVDRRPKWWAGDTVVADNEEGGFRVGEHLVRMGHRVLAAIGGPMQISSSHDRIQGFRRALVASGIRLKREYLRAAPFSAEAGCVAALELLQLAPRPTAIFAGSDLLASGALAAARRLKLRCPEDVSIVGFDDLDFASLSEPSLTTVFQPGYQMGATACSLLLTRVRGGEEPPEHTVLATELRERNSVRALAPSGEVRRRRATLVAVES